jgi:hypothetical protein
MPSAREATPVEDEINVSTFANDRLIGLDIRPRGFGFIVLEGSSVLDCGSRSCGRKDSRTCLGQRFQRILETYKPSIVAMRSRRAMRTSAAERRKALASILRAVARESKIAIVDVNLSAFREYFRLHNARTKYEIAHAVATLLPELAWKLPPQRKIWQSEHHRMSIFDAAAVALVHVGPKPDPPISVA